MPNFLSKQLGFSLTKSGLWTAVTVCGMMAGIWIFGRLADRVGRKPSFLLFQLGAVISIITYSQLTDPTAMLVAGAFLGMFVNGMMGGYGALMAEAYPTEARATAQNVLFNLGRAVGGFGPVVVGAVVSAYSFSIAIAFLAVIYVIDMVATVFLVPELKGKERIIVYAKRSVSTRIAKYLFVVIIFMGIISSLSLIVMASNKSDAEAINISGSLRMQSYRLLTEMERSLDTVEQNLVRYQRSLNADALLTVQNQLFVPSGVRESYQEILKRWAVMSDFARSHQIEKYHAELKSYVQDVDDFVLELQRFAELKWIIAVSVLCVSMLLILAMVSYVIWYMKREVVKPLEQMTKASMQVQMGQFKHIQLDTESGNELGVLAKV
ncbi:MAG: MFS transporter, partial [Haemophilus parainfluenzae]|nr:MFS transporter [Haemophilus parainfluenzae]